MSSSNVPNFSLSYNSDLFNNSEPFSTLICKPWISLKVWILKGTVSVISRNPPCKDGSVRFTTIPIKSLTNQCSETYFN